MQSCLQLASHPKFGLKNRVVLTEPLQTGLHLASAIESLVNDLRSHYPDHAPYEEQKDYDRLIQRANNLSQNLQSVFSADDPNRIYFMEHTNDQLGSLSHQITILSAPLSVGW